MSLTFVAWWPERGAVAATGTGNVARTARWSESLAPILRPYSLSPAEAAEIDDLIAHPRAFPRHAPKRIPLREEQP